ncbi:FUSC family protein [Corallococcus coralloides]|uniref:FUSC family protein n=1 Tax=Corallococcus coralloides TaxID=184914 RepID=UPI00384E7A56
MMTPRLRAWVFSLNTFVAAIAALFLGLRFSLPRPYWAMITVYIVSQPLSGALRSKAVCRLLGTVLGAAMACVLVPNLVNAPELLSLAMALWVGGCLYLALLDRTPRSYVFMLGGYTAAIIGFPGVSAPGALFATALVRVEEIGLGIVCATVVHTVLFPRPVGPVLLTRIDGFLADAGRWARDAFAGRRDARTRREWHRLAEDVTALHLLATHLPFDTAGLRPRAGAVRALHERMSMLLPILSSIEDRLAVLQGPGGAPDARRDALLRALSAWSQAGPDASRAEGQRLSEACAALAPPLDAKADWAALVTTSLAVRLAEWVDTVQDCRDLRAFIRDPTGSAPERLTPLLLARVQRPLHLDRGLALLSGIAAAAAVLLCCAVWISLAWPEGGAAAMMAAVYSCLFATQDDPVPAILSALAFTGVSFVVGGVYLFGVLPGIDGFPLLAATLAPTLLGVGLLMADPRWAGRASIAVLGLLGTLSLQERYSANLAAFLNGSLAQAAGFIAAAVSTRFLRSVGTDWSAHRLLRTGWRELAGLASAEGVPDRAGWTSRMLDRLGLLTPRLALATSRDEALEAADALADLRLGLNVVDLQRVRPHVGAAASLSAGLLLQRISGHFRARSLGRVTAPPVELLGALDATLGSVADAPASAAKRDGVLALVGLRRALFPDAAPYRAGPLEPAR